MRKTLSEFRIPVLRLEPRTNFARMAACLLVSLFSIFNFQFSIHLASAQISTNIQGIDLTLSNDSPAPGQTVIVTAQSYVADLNSSSITWTLNGSVYQKGTGITSISVQAPALGKKLTVGVTAVTPEGRTMNNSAAIKAGSVDLILESGGYAPTVFPGKVPLVYQNDYRIIAMPHLADSSGKEYDPQSLVYQWTKDSRVVQDQSGYGKQVFSWTDELVPRPRLVSVKVFARDGSSQAEKFISIQANAPFIGFYQDDPLYGTLFNIAAGNNINLGKNGEVSVLAVPFGFNKPADGPGNLSFSWLLNSIEQSLLASNQSITLRAPANTSGSSDIQLSITNNQDILEKAQAGFTASFNDSSGNTAASSNSTNNNSNYNGI